MKNRYDSAVTEAAIRKEAALRRREAALAERLRKQEADLADEAKRREQAFLAETDPVEAACIDFDRFLSRYFLDATGKVDVKKAPQVLVLHGLSDPQAALTSAEKYDGVHTQIGGLDDYPPERNHVLVIGCDYQSVYSEAMKITKRHESELEDERDWISEVRLAGHEEFVKQNGEKKQEPSGAYTVICYEIEGNWPDRGSDGLTLDIGPDRERKGELVAQFAWDVVLAGMMRFYKDGEQPEDVDTDEEVRGSRKRKRSNKRPTEEAQPKKKRPNEKSQPDPFKLHFTWQGIEGGEGEVLDSDRNRGWIRFLNENYLQFEGEISNSCLGPNVKFSGYKFSTNPEITTRWGGYAAHVYRTYWDEDRRLGITR